MPKIHLHIDLESVREAEGVTNIQSNSVINKNLLNLASSSTSSFRTKDKYDAVHLARVLKMSASILGRKHLGSISVTDYNPIIED